MVVELKELMQTGIPEVISNAISNFTCKDKDVEQFLKNKAFDFERRDKSRTYLIFSDTNQLVAYFTLSLNALPFRDNVPKKFIQRIDGFSKDVQAVGIILIGQFGKDEVQARDISGKELLEICLHTVIKAKDVIGGRFVMLECLDVPQVISFYNANDFKLLQKDSRDMYLQLVRRI